jgi:hypothetical protein
MWEPAIYRKRKFLYKHPTCWEPTALYNKSTTQKLILHSQSTPTKYQQKLDSQAITIELQPLSQKPTKTRSSIGINRLDQTAQQRNYPVNLGTLGCHPCAINKNEIICIHKAARSNCSAKELKAVTSGISPSINIISNERGSPKTAN